MGLYYKAQRLYYKLTFRKYGSVYWEKKSKSGKLSNKYILRHRNMLDWDVLIASQQLDPIVLMRCLNYCDIVFVSFYQTLDSTFILKNYKWLDWHMLSKAQHMDELVLHIHRDRVDWDEICRNNQYSFDEVMKFQDLIDIKLYRQVLKNEQKYWNVPTDKCVKKLDKILMRKKR